MLTLHNSGRVGFVNFTSAVPYNETLRLHRKFMHQQMGTKTIAASFRKDQENEVSWMLQNIMDQPEGLIDHLHRYVPLRRFLQL